MHLAAFISRHVKAMASYLPQCTSIHHNVPQPPTLTISRLSSVQCEGSLRLAAMWNPAADSTPTHQHKHLVRILSFLPPFMWNGSLPADKSIGFALWTPTCDNKRLYRQPTAWKLSAAHQLEAKVHISRGWKGKEWLRPRHEFCLWIIHTT